MRGKFALAGCILLFVFFTATCFGETVASKPAWESGQKWAYKYRNAVQDGNFSLEVMGEKSGCWLVRARLSLGPLRAEQVRYYTTEDLSLAGLETKFNIGGPVEYNKAFLLDPHMINFKWPIEVGQEWSGGFAFATAGAGSEEAKKAFDGQMTYHIKVVSQEPVIVPAGEFISFKIVEETVGGSGSVYRKERWYAPEVGNVVKEISYLSGGSLEYEMELLGPVL